MCDVSVSGRHNVGFVLKIVLLFSSLPPTSEVPLSQGRQQQPKVKEAHIHMQV